MRYFLDTEFITDGRTIDLISIGVVAADGAGEYYACNLDCDLSRADAFVQAQVLPHLPPRVGGSSVWMPRAEIARTLRCYIDCADDRPEFWGDCAAFDFVVLSQLFGVFEDWPLGWPFYINDIKQLARERGVSLNRLPPPQPAHHALFDARWVQQAWRYLQEEA